MHFIRLPLVLVLACISTLLSADTLVFSQSGKIYDAGYTVGIFEDKTGQLNLEQVRQQQFTKSDRKVPNFSVSTSTFWLKLMVRNATPKEELLLEIGYPLLDTIEFYKPAADGSFVMERFGEQLPYPERHFDHPNFIVPLKISFDQTQVYYIKVKSQEQILVPLTLGIPEVIIKTLTQKDLFFGIYVGIILVMFLYNLFIYFTTRDKGYIYYVIYILSVGLVQAALQGYTFKFLWPGSPAWAIKSIFFLSAFVGITPILFQKHFLQTRIHTPKMNMGLNIFLGIYIFYLLLFSLGYTENTYTLIQVTAMMISFYMLAVAIVLAKRGSRTAKYFLVAWTVFLVGVFMYALKDVGILPYNNFTYYTMQIGSAIETVLLSFALADKINSLKKEKEDSQRKELAASLENERIITQQNIILDQKVKERTLELSKSNEDLAITLQNLKEAQAQLVNSEKMASLGQLTAGVAHEINNPINFVSNSIKPLKRDFADVLHVLSQYEEMSEENFNEKSKEIQGLVRELDIPYVKEEIDSLLRGIEEGASRTAEIVKGLRTFSHVDETDLKRADLNEGLDSTLILLNSVLKDSYSVQKDYGDISKVECYAGKINQVFMNIMNNAIHALDKCGEGYKGILGIKTWQEGELVYVQISDNGVGIPKDIQDKIFDPFFTTKDVGEGTGLGLSIVYNIIESHNGKITVESEPGVGTAFTISLPKNQK